MGAGVTRKTVASRAAEVILGPAYGRTRGRLAGDDNLRFYPLAFSTSAKASRAMRKESMPAGTPA